MAVVGVGDGVIMRRREHVLWSSSLGEPVVITGAVRTLRVAMAVDNDTG